MAETIQLRIHSPQAARTLIYLPGLHGDWTLVGGFRRALAEQSRASGGVRFVEFTYPRTLTWSLSDYAEAVEGALAEKGIARGWLIGESFSSQVVWPILERQRFQVEGLILAGGFVRHPMRWGVRAAERMAGGVSMTWLARILFGYAKIARFRYRHSPETITGIHEFIARRTEQDRQAARHRLHLLAANDPGFIARNAQVPVYGLTGVLDPVVPWMFVRRWLKKNCPSLRDYRIIWNADHNVLGTAPDSAAAQVLKWMT